MTFKLKRRFVWCIQCWSDVIGDVVVEETLYVMLLLKSCCVWRIRCSRDIFYDITESVGGWVAVPRIPEFRLAFDVKSLKLELRFAFEFSFKDLILSVDVLFRSLTFHQFSHSTIVRGKISLSFRENRETTYFVFLYKMKMWCEKILVR